MAEIDVTRIAGNIGAMNALNQLGQINKQMSVHQTRLASGKRINSAADDPAGLTIATKMNARSEGLKVALNNIGDAKNLLAVAESGMGRINDILVQMRNKAEQGASDTLGTEERKALVSQMTAYAQQIQDIVGQTKWNGKKLLNGLADFGGSQLTFQTGADQGDTTVLSGLANMGIDALDLAAVAGAAGGTASIVNDAGGVLNTATMGAKSNALTSDLRGGQYTVQIVTGAAGADYQVSLHSGNTADNASRLLVDANNDIAEDDMNVVMTTADATTSFDFGNGLTLATDALAANTTYTFTVGVTETTGGQVTGLHLADVGNTVINENSSASQFATYMNDINTALNTVSENLSKLGSLTGRLSFKEDQISAAQINVESSYNRIMNANMAEEQVNASKYQILQQTATAMLAQANAAPQFLLSLFR